MLDQYAKEQYKRASTLLDEISGEDIRELLLSITIENARVNIFKSYESTIAFSRENSNILERLSKSLLLRLIYDNELDMKLIEGAALVCAQAYETLAPKLQISNVYSINDAEILNRITAGLLYYIAGYDPNAAQIILELNELAILSNESNNQLQLIRNLQNLISLELNNIVSLEIPKITLSPNDYLELETTTSEILYWELNECILLIKSELLFHHEKWNEEVSKKITQLYHISIDCQEYTISQICLLLLLTNKAYSSRAISVIKAPTDCSADIWGVHMQRYINERYYLIWPPHKEALDKGLLNHQNDIIAIPTGTGKSLIAEHKIITSLQRGSLIIYLAPTLALCRQINAKMNKIRDVQNMFQGQTIIVDDFDNIEFDFLDENKRILVMTPEKCSSLLSNRPDLFTELSLCVVDEFHNIKEGQRGALLDSLLSRISNHASNCVYLLLSALIDNSEILPKWLNNLNQKPVTTTFTRWRPSRTIRGFISHPNNEYAGALRSAKESGRSSYSAQISADLFFCVQDVWSQGGGNTAFPIRIPGKMNIRFKKSNNNWNVTGYGNDISRQLGNWLASCSMPVLVFSQTTRHLLGEIDKHKQIRSFNQELNDRVKAYLTFAELELGYQSELLNGLSMGIGVHTQALIEEEQEAVEEFFKSSKVGVICSTGTLAQGLNLPASAVVVNTTKQFSLDDIPRPMSKEEVINMLGRAGRPGLGFQSIGIIVPQYPSTYDQRGYNLESEYTSYLERIDAVVPVGSGLSNLIVNAAISLEDSDPDNYMFLIHAAARELSIDSVTIKKTLASYMLNDNMVDQAILNTNKWLQTAQDDINMRRVLQIAQKNAISIHSAQSLIKSINIENTLILLDFEVATEGDWITWFLINISNLENSYLVENVHKLFTTPQIINDFIRAWVNGKSIFEIALILYQHGIGRQPRIQSRDSQNSISKVIHILQDGKRNIVHIANCYISIVEQVIRDSGREIPISQHLLKLPQYLNMGVNNDNALYFRRRNIPRMLSLEFGEMFNSPALMLSTWKSVGDISGVELDENVKKAILVLI